MSLVATSNLKSTAEAICPCQFDFADLAQDDDTCLPSLDDKDALSVMQSSCTFKGGHYCITASMKERMPQSSQQLQHSIVPFDELGSQAETGPECTCEGQE